jgi:DNA-binding ferritin-like protein (Dps family)
MAKSHRAMANPAELAIMTAAVDNYCVKHGIAAGPMRDDIAFRVLQLFQNGVIDPSDLSDGLDAVPMNFKRRA